MADQPVNALHVLKICTETPALRHIRISLLLDDSEAYVVPQAFELGCLSYHHKPFTKDTLSSELKNLLAVLESLKFNEPLTAAHYLRHYLKTSKDFQSQAGSKKPSLTSSLAILKRCCIWSSPVLPGQARASTQDSESGQAPR